MISIISEFKRTNMVRKHGFKLFRAIEIVSILIYSLRNILETFPNAYKISENYSQ